MTKTVQILNTPKCKVYHEREGFVLYMKLENGGWLKNNTFNNDLTGLISALTLGIDVVAGKVWPKSVVSELPDEAAARKTGPKALPPATISLAEAMDHSLGFFDSKKDGGN